MSDGLWLSRVHSDGPGPNLRLPMIVLSRSSFLSHRFLMAPSWTDSTGLDEPVLLLYLYAENQPTILKDPTGLWGQGEDETCLICTVYAEARGQNQQCQWGVASVILNRLADRRTKNPGTPTSVCDIVSAPGQFDGYGNDNYKNCTTCSVPPDDLDDLRKTHMNFEGGFNVFEGPTFFGNNTPTMRDYFGRRLGLTQIPLATCPTLIFFGQRR